LETILFFPIFIQNGDHGMPYAANSDQALIGTLTEIVLANLQNEHFGVNELVREAGVSRSVLHRRLRAIQNQNISQFIREVRLKKAMELLQQNAGTAAEISYEVGFGSPAYFTKCFHEYYGITPGEVKNKPLQAPSQESAPERQPERRIGLAAGLAALLLVLSWFTHSYFSETGPFRPRRDLSIIVLPFKNFSGDPGDQYFADGIMEDVLNSLFRISDLRVISRTTSEYYRETRRPIREIAKEVNASHVLEGSIRKQGEQVRISVQLIDPYRDNHLWSANFDREFTNLIGIQGDIAIQVARKMHAVISEQEIRQIGQMNTQSAEAYDNYLQARFLLHKAKGAERYDFDLRNVEACLQYYEKAIAADSNFAEAYAGLANAWFNLSAWGFLPNAQGFPKSKTFSEKAIQLDPDCAEAHAVLGAYYVWAERQFEKGGMALQTAVQLDPNFSTARQWYAQLLMITGPIEEARVQIDRALELESYFWVVHNLNAWIYYFEEKHDKAIEACLIARDLKPVYTANKWLLVLNYAKMGEGEKAAMELQKMVNDCRNCSFGPDEVMEAYRETGIPGLFRWLIEVNKNRPVQIDGLNGHPFFNAWWSLMMGDAESAIYWLQKNMEQKRKMHFYFDLIATNPDFDPLRSDPRFLDIIEKIGLAPYHRRALL
jgi:TolB-like protein/AraC-like DNA-binding protein